MGMYWIVDANHEAKQVDDVMEWGKWFENDDNRRVASSDFDGGIHVSTVCLGLDHQWGIGPPLIYETMIFAKGLQDLDQQMWRYSTWAEAETGHAAAVALVQSFLSNKPNGGKKAK